MTALGAHRHQPSVAGQREWAQVASRCPAAGQHRPALSGPARRVPAAGQRGLDRRARCGASAVHLVDEHPEVQGFCRGAVATHIEGYKLALANHVTAKGTPLSANTLRMRLGMLLTLLRPHHRVGLGGRPGAHAPSSQRHPTARTSRCPRPSTTPRRPASCGRWPPRAGPAARVWCSSCSPAPGLRVGELCALEHDAVARRGGGYWLQGPGREAQKRPHWCRCSHRSSELLADWQATHDDAGTGLLLTNDGRPLNRHVVTRMVNRVAKRAGIGHVHPHQLRHTLATQAVNRGMRLESIAELLGHRTLRMTIRYARIANKTVADEYRAAAAKVEALYDGARRTCPRRRPCAGFASSTAACSETAGARDRRHSTAASRRCARAAGSSPPPSSSKTP